MAGRRRTRIPLDVFLNGRLVGELRRETSGAIDFRYAQTWLGWENSFPVSLSLPLREDRYIGQPVVAVFDNLLPDNVEIRQRLAARTQAGGTDAFSLLAAIGRDCVGALQFMPGGEAPAITRTPEGRPITDAEVAAIIGELGQSPLGVTAGNEFRISLAGAQEKTALLRWNDQWHIPHGSTPTTHIIKPRIGRTGQGIDLSDSVENEFFCMKLAQAAGLPTAEVSMQSFSGTRVLVVERFDRLWTRDGRLLRLPQEDTCQALSVPPVLKYQSDGGPGLVSLLELLRASDEPAADQRRLLSAQLFFWLIGATDGHAKNFSIHLLPGTRFHLAPLYDVMSAQPYVAAHQIRRNQFKLAMSVGRNRHYVVDEIRPRHFLQTAEAAGVDPAVVEEIMADLAQRVSAAAQQLTRTLPADFPMQLAEQIVGGIESRMQRLSSGH